MARSLGSVAGTLPILCLAAAGCSDPKAARDANFRKALEPVVADAFCRTIPATRMVQEGRSQAAAYPLTVATGEAPGAFYDRDYDKASVEMLDAAARAGLLTREEGELVVKPLGSSVAAVRRRVATYAPTQAGAAYFRAVDERTYGGVTLPFPEICGARGELVDVVRWSEPSDFGGRRVSQVTYRYRGGDPIPLAAPTERTKAAEPVVRTVPMVLESDGWRIMPR